MSAKDLRNYRVLQSNYEIVTEAILSEDIGQMRRIIAAFKLRQPKKDSTVEIMLDRYRERLEERIEKLEDKLTKTYVVTYDIAYTISRNSPEMAVSDSLRTMTLREKEELQTETGREFTISKTTTISAVSKDDARERFNKERRHIILSKRWESFYKKGKFPSSIKIKNLKFEERQEEEFLEIPMFEEINVVEYDWSQTYETKISCVESYFINQFKNKRGFLHNQRYEITRKKIRDITNKYNTPEYRHLKKLGYTIKDVKKICQYLDLRMFAYDIDFENVESYIPEKLNTYSKKIIAFVNSDNHFYPIKSEYISNQKSQTKIQLKKKIYTTENDKQTDKYHFNTKIIKKKQNEIEYISQDELNSKFIQENQTIKHVKFDGAISGINISNTRYGREYEDKIQNKLLIEDFKKTNKLIPSAPTPSILGTKLMPDLSTVKSNAVKSIFDKIYDPLMTRICYENKKNTKTISIDIKRHYTNALRNDFIQIDLHSQVELYTKDYPYSYYYGKHKEFGYVWCPFPEQLEDKKYIIRGYKLEKPFEEFLEITEDLNLSKQIVNHSIGILKSKQDYKKYRTVRTTSQGQAFNLFNKGYSMKKYGNIYLCHKQTKERRLSDSIHIHNQIVWFAYKNLQKLADKFKKIYSIKTDSICGIPKPDAKFEKSLYRLDNDHNLTETNLPPNFHVKHYNKITDLKKFKKTEIKDDFSLIGDKFRQGYSFFLYGKAGSQKTRILKSLMRMSKSYIAVSPQNCPAYDIKGITFEKLLTKNLEYDKINQIFIDECGLMSINDLETCIKIKQINPKIQFIAAGDFNQMPRVITDNKPDINICDLQAFRNLTDHNQVYLTKNFRNDLDYTKDYKITDFEKTDEIYKKNICYKNATRVSVNHNAMVKFKPETSTYIQKHPRNIKGQAMWLYDDLPLRFIKNLPKHNLYNGTEKTYKEIKSIFTDNQIAEYTVPAYCYTLYGIQGKTIRETYVIHDSDLIFSNYNYKYTAYSRCIKKSMVKIN